MKLPPEPAAAIWSAADLLRGALHPAGVGSVILTLTVLRRTECLAADGARPDLHAPGAPMLSDLAEHSERAGVALREYLLTLPPKPGGIVQQLGFTEQIDALSSHMLIPTLVRFFADQDLSPGAVSDEDMGSLFDHLIARWTDQLSHGGGELFTPRDVVDLMLALLLPSDAAQPRTKPTIIYDPVCGTGGTLGGAHSRLAAPTPDLDNLRLVGQDLNARALAICEAELLLRGADYDLRAGDTLKTDEHPDIRFDYALARPPFGLSWRYAREAVQASPDRFPAGLPATSDATWLFVQHIASKMKPREQGGARAIILVSGQALVGGRANHGEAEIRHWMIEHDLIDAVISLPDQLLPHTAIPCYALVLSNNKQPDHEGRIALVDARGTWGPASRPTGHKYRRLQQEHIDQIVSATRARNGPSVRERTLDEFRADENGGGAWAIEPWMFLARIDGSSHAPLEVYADRPPPTRPEPDESLIRTVGRGGDIELDEIGEAASRRLYTPCTSGDLVGRGPNWVVLPDDLPQAYTTLDVLRPKQAYASRRHLLMLWLTSPEAQRQFAQGAISRIDLRMRVPRRLMEDDRLAQASEELRVAQAQADGHLAGLLDTPFSRPTTDITSLSVDELLTHASRLKSLVSLLGPMTDAFQRAEWSFPSQIADLARQYRIEKEPERRLRTGQLLAESLARHVGLLAAACVTSSDEDSLHETLRHFEGGISTGSWLRIVQAAQGTDSRVALPPLLEVSFRKRGVGSYLKQAIEMRNRQAHAHGLLPAAVVADQLDELEPLLTASLEGLAWLSSVEIVHVRRCEYENAQAGFQVHTVRLHGAHPTWEPVTFSSVEPIARDQVIALNVATPKPLRLDPFMVVSSCPECRREELYILDRAWANDDHLRSVSVRNHQIQLKRERTS